jgi:hypothetical protein
MFRILKEFKEINSRLIKIFKSYEHLFVFLVLGTKPRTLCMLSRHCIT